MPLTALRTDDDRFANLPGFPYQPRYVEDLPGFAGLRMAYLDEGPADGEVLLCLHGEPTWSYLYRKMIPVFTAAGLRVIAPDLFGFGRSDKPVDDAAYSFDFHRDSLLALIAALRLQRFGLVVQDWGGLLGLTLPVALPGAVDRLLVMNTALGVSTPPGEGFLAWRRYVADHPDLDVAALMQRAVPGLTDAEARAYAAPWPDARSKAGVRMFPQLVPTSPQDPGVEVSRQAAGWWADQWQGPTVMAVGIHDPILGPPVMARLRRMIRGCPEPLLVEQGHFVQESGQEVAQAALRGWA
jgi:pimeloyl-ACP methyl ester carboxylesterase